MQLTLQPFLPGFAVVETQELGKKHNRGLYLSRTLWKQDVALKDISKADSMPPYQQFYTYTHHGIKKLSRYCDCDRVENGIANVEHTWLTQEKGLITGSKLEWLPPPLLSLWGLHRWAEAQTNDVGIESHEDVVSTPNQITEVVITICGTEPCCLINDGDGYTYDKSTYASKIYPNAEADTITVQWQQCFYIWKDDRVLSATTRQ